MWLPSPQAKRCGEREREQAKEERVIRALQPGSWAPSGLPSVHYTQRPVSYLGADAEVMVGDELRTLLVACMEPGVEGAEGHAGKRQHEGQQTPSAGYI